MSTKSKSANHDKRMSEKRARKAAQRAKYESYKGTAANQKNKSRRSRIAARKTTKKALHIGHVRGPCFNVGCRKCNPSNLPEKTFYTSQAWFNKTGQVK